MSLTLIITVITVLTSIAALGSDRRLSRWVLNPYRAIQRKEYWRFITSGFVHNGYAHLGLNMFTFFFFGRAVEEILSEFYEAPASSFYFVMFYLSAIVVSDLPVALKHRHNPGYNSLGASGAVSAMVFCSILFFPLNKICLYGLLCLPGFVLGLLYIIYSYYQARNTAGGGINHEAHLHGALYGISFGLILYPDAASLFFRQIMNYGDFW